MLSSPQEVTVPASPNPLLASAPWYLAIAIAIVAGWWATRTAHRIYRLKKADDARKELADKLHRLADRYGQLRALGATILTHEGERETFRREAGRVGFTAEEIDACILNLGGPDPIAVLSAGTALDAMAADAERARHDKTTRPGDAPGPVENVK